MRFFVHVVQLFFFTSSLLGMQNLTDMQKKRLAWASTMERSVCESNVVIKKHVVEKMQLSNERRIENFYIERYLFQTKHSEFSIWDKEIKAFVFSRTTDVDPILLKDLAYTIFPNGWCIPPVSFDLSAFLFVAARPMQDQAKKQIMLYGLQPFAHLNVIMEVDQDDLLGFVMDDVKPEIIISLKSLGLVRCTPYPFVATLPRLQDRGKLVDTHFCFTHL